MKKILHYAVIFIVVFAASFAIAATPNKKQLIKLGKKRQPIGLSLLNRTTPGGAAPSQERGQAAREIRVAGGSGPSLALPVGREHRRFIRVVARAKR